MIKCLYFRQTVKTVLKKHFVISNMPIMALCASSMSQAFSTTLRRVQLALGLIINFATSPLLLKLPSSYYIGSAPELILLEKLPSWISGEKTGYLLVNILIKCSLGLILRLYTCCPRSHGMRPKSFMLVRRCYQLQCGFLVKCHLLPVSRQSRLSDNNGGDNEVKPGVVHIFLSIYLMTEENLGKSSQEIV